MQVLDQKEAREQDRLTMIKEREQDCLDWKQAVEEERKLRETEREERREERRAFIEAITASATAIAMAFANNKNNNNSANISNQ